MASLHVSKSNSKWLSIIASTYIQSTSGSSYCFSLYSPLLKRSQSYSQSTLDSVAVFKDIGANVGVLSGVLYSYLGPRAVLAVGAVQCFVGYLFIWMCVVGMLPRQPVWLVRIFMLMAAHAQTFFNTADVVAAVENFPESRGTVIGIMKGFLGLSGAILIQLYRTFFNGKESSFILMLALLPSFLPLLLMYFIKVHHYTNTSHDKKHLESYSLISLLTASYLMLIIILENIFTLGLLVRLIALSFLLFLLLSPLLIVTKPINKIDDPVFRRKPSMQNSNSSSDQNTTLNLPLIKGSSSDESSLNLLQAMKKLDFWLLFISMACGMGSGLATINNMAQIGTSLNYSTMAISTLTSLWSIWNFTGRFGSGYVSDHFLKSKGWARPIFIAITLGIMSMGHAIISTGWPASLHVGSVIVGVCYGSQWALMPSVTSELFGIRHFGTIFNAIAVASPVGSYVFSVRVVGYVYDMETRGGGPCLGPECFRASFLVMACFTGLGFGVALGLFFRTRRFYREVVLARLHE